MLHSYLYTETNELLNHRAHMETLRRDSNTEGMTDAWRANILSCSVLGIAIT
jgi:hypothetical protein